MNYNIIINLTEVFLYVTSAYLFFSSCSDRININKKRIAVLFSLLNIFLIFSPFVLPVNLCICIIFQFFISINYNYEFKKSLILILIFNVIICVSKFLAFIFTDLLDIELYIGTGRKNVISAILSSLFIYVAIYFIYKFNSFKNKKYKFPKYFYVLYAILGIFIALFYYNSVKSSSLDPYSKFYISLALVAIVCMISLIDKKICNSMTVYAERNIYIEQLRAFENQKEILEKSSETIMNLRHDMKNHIIALVSLSESNENVKEYANKIIGELDETKNFSKSGNLVLDSLINLKLSKLVDVNIKTYIKVPTQLNILAYDLTVVLGNLLDNASYALSKVKCDKFLRIEIFIEKGNLVISIKNTFDKTAKGNEKGRGRGLKNIKSSLEKYGGYMTVTQEDNIFSSIILIPQFKESD